MKSKRLLSLMLLCFAVFGVARAQVTIGDLETAGNDTYLPMNSLYEYSYSQQIYTADEIGTAGTINAITIWMYGAADLYTIPFDIYMVETDKVSFTGTDWESVSSSDIVYSGSVTVHNTTAEAYTFELDAPFAYSGTGNLMIAFDNNCGQWKGGLNGKVFTATDNVSRSMYVRQDNNDYDPTNMSSITGTARAMRNVIEIDITPGGGPSCARPTGLAINYTGGTTAEVSWNSDATAWNIDVNGTVTAITTNPYTLTDLELGTAYTVKVQANCGGGDLSDWSSAKSFTTDLCLPENMCELRYDLVDSYGDGWNGNAIKVVDAATGAEIANLTITSGSSASGRFSVCDGRAINFVWVAGSYPSETSYTFYDINNDEIFSGSAGNGLITDYTVNCTPAACPKPQGLTVSYTGGTEATISWTSDAEAWNIDVNGTVTAITENPYTLTGLELATDYEVKVQADCGDATSDWVGPVSFTTDDCMPEDQIVVNYTLTDSYGDGWNGNYILVVDESCNIVNQLTIESGSSATGTLRVCGSYVQFLWYKGNYPTETSWVFTDNAGNVLFEGAGSADMATLDVLYTIDNNPFSAPTDVAASEVGPRSAKLSWTETGTATAWQIKLTAGDDEEGTIIDANSNPFVITGLTPETDYFAQVRATGANGTSIWTCIGADFTTTEACPAPQNIVVSDVTANSALVSWLGFGESYDLRYVAVPSSKGMRSSINKKPAKTDFNCKTSFGNVKFASSNNKPAMVSGVTGVQHNRDGWYYYDNGVNEGGSIGTNGGTFYWGIMIPAGSYLETSLTKTSVYDVMAMTGNVTIYNDGTDAPAGEALAQADVTLTGAGAFVETEFSEPVTIDPSKNLWIVYYNGSGATYPAAYCSAATDANGRWVSIDGTSWMDVASAVEGAGDFMVRAYLEGAIEIDWIEVPGITASEYELTGLDPETTYLVQIRSNCGDEGQSDYAGTNFTTMSLCDNPYDLDTIEVNASSAILNWTGAQESYNLRYRHALEIDPTAPAIIILEAHDTWGDGTGYQMLLDADATAYGVEIPESGPYTGTDYSAFEYLIPENADCDSNTENLVLDGSITLEIPAGVYDWCIINPEPGGNMWISGNGDIPGRYNDYVFEPGVTYHFTMQRFGTGDGAALEITRPMSDWTVVENVTSPYELTGLTAETYYEWQIQGINEECDELEWVAGPNFTTLEQTTVTQTVELAAGPNWFSTYVDITLDDLKAALVSEAPANSTITIKSATQNTVYSRGRWNGTLDWDVANMYIIIVPAECEITLEGMPLNPEEHPITIVGNGNPTWIGFPYSNSMTVTAAFDGFAVNGDIIKSSNNNSQYSRGRWNGSVTNLEPGHGYIYVSAPGSSDRTFVYPSAR